VITETGIIHRQILTGIIITVIILPEIPPGIIMQVATEMLPPAIQTAIITATEIIPLPLPHVIITGIIHRAI
jgi:hypothetical protein